MTQLTCYCLPACPLLPACLPARLPARPPACCLLLLACLLTYLPAPAPYVGPWVPTPSSTCCCLPACPLGWPVGAYALIDREDIAATLAAASGSLAPSPSTQACPTPHPAVGSAQAWPSSASALTPSLLRPSQYFAGQGPPPLSTPNPFVGQGQPPPSSPPTATLGTCPMAISMLTPASAATDPGRMQASPELPGLGCSSYTAAAVGAARPWGRGSGGSSAVPSSLSFQHVGLLHSTPLPSSAAPAGAAVAGSETRAGMRSSSAGGPRGVGGEGDAGSSRRKEWCVGAQTGGRVGGRVCCECVYVCVEEPACPPSISPLCMPTLLP